MTSADYAYLGADLFYVGLLIVTAIGWYSWQRKDGEKSSASQRFALCMLFIYAIANEANTRRSRHEIRVLQQKVGVK